MNKACSFTLFYLGIFLCHSSVNAQIAYEPTWSPPDLMALNNIKFNPVVNGVIEEGRRDDNSLSDVVSKRSTIRPVVTTYSFSKSRTRSNLNALAQRMQASDPANGAQMEKLLASTDVIGPVKGVMRQLGLEQNNVAHAYAVYWVIYWGLANNVHDTPSAGAMQAVARQAEINFVANADFAIMDDAAKQQAAEELMVLAAIMDATSEQAKSDPALAAQAAKAALQGSKASGLELDKMTLTEEGFKPTGKKRSDAVDVVQGKAEGLASADANDEGWSNGELALVAAAGGAGLAGVFMFRMAIGKKA